MLGCHFTLEIYSCPVRTALSRRTTFCSNNIFEIIKHSLSLHLAGKAIIYKHGLCLLCVQHMDLRMIALRSV